jgi:hypothetical protein
LDLFTGSLSDLVGQDYTELSETCNWIKPMIYCRAAGPAGLPVELASLGKALRSLCPELDEKKAYSLVSKAFGWAIPETEAKLLKEGLPVEIISSELALIAARSMAPGVHIYAGIEAMRDPVSGIGISEDLLSRFLSHLTEDAKGVIASWNLLTIPEENLRLLGKYAGG